MSIAVSPGDGVYGTDFVVSGDVTCHGVRVSNATVEIYRKFVGAGRIDILEAVTDVQGRYAIRDHNLRASADYSGAWTGRSPCESGAETGPTRTRAVVRPGVTVNVTDSTLQAGRRATFSGSVLPGHSGRRVHLQMYRGSERRWVNVATARLTSRSTYSFFYTNEGDGYLIFRVAYPTQDLDHGWNLSRVVRVDWS